VEGESLEGGGVSDGTPEGTVDEIVGLESLTVTERGSATVNASVVVGMAFGPTTGVFTSGIEGNTSKLGTVVDATTAIVEVVADPITALGGWTTFGNGTVVTGSTGVWVGWLVVVVDTSTIGWLVVVVDTSTVGGIVVTEAEVVGCVEVELDVVVSTSGVVDVAVVTGTVEVEEAAWVVEVTSGEDVVGDDVDVDVWTTVDVALAGNWVVVVAGIAAMVEVEVEDGSVVVAGDVVEDGSVVVVVAGDVVEGSVVVVVAGDKVEVEVEVTRDVVVDGSVVVVVVGDKVVVEVSSGTITYPKSIELSLTASGTNRKPPTILGPTAASEPVSGIALESEANVVCTPRTTVKRYWTPPSSKSVGTLILYRPGSTRPKAVS
jgi:hypothetical protein